MKLVTRYIALLLRFQFRLLAGLAVGFFAFFLLLLNATLQEFAGEQVALWLSNSLKTEVRIEGFRYRPMRRFEMGKLYIEDHYGDTLLVADSLRLQLGSLRLLRQQIDLSKIEIGHLDARLSRKAYEQNFNFDFLINFFAAAPTDTVTTPSSIRFRLGALKLRDGRLSFADDTRPRLTNGFDPAHWKVQQLRFQVDSIFGSADSSSVHLKQLAFKEAGGLSVKEISGKLAVLPDGLRLDRLRLRSSHSQLAASVKLSYGSYDDFEDFNERVRLFAEIDQLSVGTPDLRWLLGSRAPGASVYASGELSGRLSRLRSRNLELGIGQQSFIRGAVSITGLPDFEAALYDLRFDEAYFDWQELAAVLRLSALPEQLQGLTYLQMQGDAFGYLNDFVAKGEFGTNLGQIRSDLNIKLDPQTSTYSGFVALEDFNLGQLTGDSLLGKIDLATDIKGRGNTWEDFEGQLNGQIHFVDYNKYRYQGIQLDGYLDRQAYSGQLNIVDSNAHLRFFGLADLSGEVPFFNFVAEIDTIQLQALGFTQDTIGISGYAELCGEGASLDALFGEFSLRLMQLGFNQRSLQLNELNVFSYSDSDFPRRLRLESPFGMAEIRGDFAWSTFPTLVKHYVHHFVQREKQPPLSDSLQFVEADFDFSQAQTLADWLAPGEYTIGPLRGHATLATATNELDLAIEAPELRQGSVRLNNLQLLGTSDNDSLFFDLYADTLWYADALLAQQLSLEHVISNDTLGFQVRAMGEAAYNDLRLDGQIDFAHGAPALTFAPSVLTVYDNSWELSQEGAIVFEDSVVFIPSVQFNKSGQFVGIQGRLGARPSDTLHLQLQDVDLQQLNPLLSIYKTSMEGYANMDLQAQSLLGEAAVFGTIAVSELVLDGQPLGDLNVSSVYAIDRGEADLKAELVSEGDTLAIISGTLGQSRSAEQVNLQARLSHSPIHPLEHLLKPTFTDVSGRATAQLFLRGTWRDLELTGQAELEQARTRVDFLNQYYNINKRVLFTPTSIDFDGADITDDSGGKGTLGGKILHQSFRRTRLDLQLDAENLLVLNTEPNFTDAYFGTGRLTGRANFTGPIDLVDIQIRATTERGTRFAIPLDAETNRANLDFITFVDKSDTLREEPEDKGFEVSGINFGMNVTATPEAEFSILFDRVAGDIIKGRGAGSIEFRMDPQGEIQMFGNYTFSGGDYSFTLANIPTKRFRISEGSTIQWTGDPYDATINLNAVYRQRANVDPLLTEAQRVLINRSNGRARTYMNVDTYLKLTGSLLRPTINFEIKLPTVNENDASDVLVARIQNINNNEQELNNQVLGLLVAGQFIPNDNSNAANNFIGSTGANSLTEALSNQLNNVLSQVFDNVNIGINYRSSNLGTVTDVTRNDLTVALNTTLFNDRVRIDGNVGNTLQAGTAGNTSAQNLAGEVIVEYLITPDGSLKVKAFNKLDDRIIVNRESNYRQGVGISYTENYDHFSELLEKPKRFIQDRLLRRIPWLPDRWKGDF